MKIIQELQPPSVAIDAEVGDFVMFDEDCREVARKFQLYENGEVEMVPTLHTSGTARSSRPKEKPQ